MWRLKYLTEQDGNMMEQWVREKLVDYKYIFEKYIVEEAAISNCALSMSKILNGLSEMTYTQFHWYEKKMLWKAVEVFSKQCIEQMRYALQCGDVSEKKAVIADIETSISGMMDVYKNILDGTANAERQIVQSLSMETHMYELSPKMCAFYSAIMDTVIDLFTEGKTEYAFIMHPTLQSTIETRILLRQRKKSGKVMIVYIPESVIEEFDMVVICLLHEVFHVITKNERYRKKRAKYFLLHMLIYVEFFLFENVNFSYIIEDDEQIKRELMNIWFVEAKEKLKEFNSKEDFDMCFYSDNIKREVVGLMKHCLMKINYNIKDVVMRISFKRLQVNEYRGFREMFDKTEKSINIIQKNVHDIIMKNALVDVADRLIFIYREAFADIGCVLTLQLAPEQYRAAFLKSIQFRYDNSKYFDTNREIREILVMKTVMNLLPSEQQSDWENALKYCGNSYQKNTEVIRQKEHQSASEKKYNDNVRMIMFSQAMDNFEEYLFLCGEAISRRLSVMDKIDNFRKYIRKVLREDSQEEVLIRILAGSVYQG